MESSCQDIFSLTQFDTRGPTGVECEEITLLLQKLFYMVGNLYVLGEECMLPLSMNYLYKISAGVISANLLTFPILSNNLHLPKHTMS